MKLKLLRTKAKTPEGKCRAVGCVEESTCTWRHKKVCSKHYFYFRNLARLNFNLKKEKSYGH